jgi:hypothetical protein
MSPRAAVGAGQRPKSISRLQTLCGERRLEAVVNRFEKRPRNV